MSDFNTWSQAVRERLDRLREEGGFDVPEPSSPPTEQIIVPPHSPFPSTASSEFNPLFHEDPMFELLQSLFPTDFVNFDLPDPKPKMTTIREQNGQVHGATGGAAPSNITYPAVAEGKSSEFELKSGFLHQLPKFHGLSGEDPNQHLTHFKFTYESMCPRGANLQHVKMKSFPFSLEDRARKWLFEVPAGRITSWTTMVNEFLLKYFPSSRVTHIRKQITRIKQGGDESFCVYYERFKSLVASCPSHEIREGLLLQYFYEGLRTI